MTAGLLASLRAIVGETSLLHDPPTAGRKALSPTRRNVAPKKINEDIVMPVSRLPKLVRDLQQLSEQYNIKIVNCGRAGNVNLHTNLLLGPNDPQQCHNAEQCLDAVFSLALKLIGTISGEHRVGIKNARFYWTRNRPGDA